MEEPQARDLGYAMGVEARSALGYPKTDKSFGAFMLWINNVSIKPKEGDEEVDQESLWIAMFGSLFDTYHGHRHAYFSGAVFTMKAYIMGTIMAYAQKLEGWCDAEIIVCTLVTCLLAAWVVVVRPFPDDRHL